MAVLAYDVSLRNLIKITLNHYQVISYRWDVGLEANMVLNLVRKNPPTINAIYFVMFLLCWVPHPSTLKVDLFIPKLTCHGIMSCIQGVSREMQIESVTFRYFTNQITIPTIAISSPVISNCFFITLCIYISVGIIELSSSCRFFFIFPNTRTVLFLKIILSVA